MSPNLPESNYSAIGIAEVPLNPCEEGEIGTLWETFKRRSLTGHLYDV